MYIGSMRKSFKDSLKVLEADVQHANTLASDFPQEFDGACLQMRISYSPAAHLFLFLVQWTDCQLAGALGLLRILIYKVYVDGTTTMSTHERKASIREFYAVIYPSLQQLQNGVTDTEDKKQKAVCMERYPRRDYEELRQYSDVDIEREEECGICMEMFSKIVLPNCNHAMCLKCYREWRSRSQSCPFCRDSLKRVNSSDLWVFMDSRDIIDMATISVVVLLQLWTATFVHDASWLKILVIAYFFGSFLNHNLFLAIHELSHNLAFSTPSYNRWLGIFANLPIGVPMSVTFQKYHLEHHRFQGVDGVDMDVPSLAEAYVVRNVFTKSIWVILQLFFYALRPLFLKPKPPGYWEFINFGIQIALDVSMVRFWGWKSLAYIILSTFVGGGMHPMAGHFISEHYVFSPNQETYSYYGPLNLMTWHVGYHNEHHDFPRIPGNKLHKVKEIAPQYYEGLESYKSWSQVIYMYIMDRTVGPYSRMKRKVSSSSTTKKSE